MTIQTSKEQTDVFLQLKERIINDQSDNARIDALIEIVENWKDEPETISLLTHLTQIENPEI
jgi:hypothetical protein